MRAPDRRTIQPLIFLGILCLGATAAAFAQNIQQPASGYLEAKLVTGLDAGHTRPGEAFQARVLSWWSIPACTLYPGASIYGNVVSAVRHTKSFPESSLGLLMESADCEDHPRTPLALHILEITTPDSLRVPLHSVLPAGGGGMSTASGVIAHDDNTAPEEATSAIRIGAVVGAIPMRLGIAEGPHFAELLHCDKRNVSLLSGTRLVLGTADMIPADPQLHLQPAEKQP